MDAEPPTGRAATLPGVGSAPATLPAAREPEGERHAPEGVLLHLQQRQRLLALADLLLLNLALLAGLGRSLELPWSLATVSEHWIWFVTYSVLWLTIANAGDNYNTWRTMTPTISIIGVSKALALTELLYAVLPLVTPPPAPSRTLMLTPIAMRAGLLILWRLAFAAVFAQQQFRRRAIVVGAGQAGRAIARAVEEREPSYVLLGFVDGVEAPGSEQQGLPLLGSACELGRLQAEHRATDLILATTEPLESPALREMLGCYERGVRIVPMPALYEQITGRIPVEHIGDRWFVSLPIDRDTRDFYRLVKRVMDVAASLVGIALLAPFFPLVALLIKLDSRGPVFYRPERLGKGGQPFRLWKLRTMVSDADRLGDPTFTSASDSRVTRLGRLLRAAHIDELPQFLNILKGEMSLVGPRPERHVPELEQQIPFYRMRLAVKPGTAGWALVKQGYAEGIEGTLVKLQYDLYYIKHQSPYLDLVILIRTVIDMLFRRGR